jgi:hypothetical protein
VDPVPSRPGSQSSFPFLSTIISISVASMLSFIVVKALIISYYLSRMIIYSLATRKSTCVLYTAKTGKLSRRKKPLIRGKRTFAKRLKIHSQGHDHSVGFNSEWKPASLILTARKSRYFSYLVEIFSRAISLNTKILPSFTYTFRGWIYHLDIRDIRCERGFSFDDSCFIGPIYRGLSQNYLERLMARCCLNRPLSRGMARKCATSPKTTFRQKSWSDLIVILTSILRVMEHPDIFELWEDERSNDTLPSGSTKRIMTSLFYLGRPINAILYGYKGKKLPMKRQHVGRSRPRVLLCQYSK